MFVRRLLSAFTIGVCALGLAACDFAGADSATGRWVGTASFSADTILSEYNTRIVAEYETEFVFLITDDEGLITGTLTATTVGQRISAEAGQPADTVYFDAAAPFVNEFFGTYVDPTLELDVPDGPYEANLWTFEVSGRRAELERFLLHTHSIPLANGEPFQFTMLSDEEFDMRRESSSAE